jgi:hypothetical protein
MNMNVKTLLALIAMVTPLAGCNTFGETGNAPPASVAGACDFLDSPEYAVLGKTPYDQRWINRTEESIVTGCRKPRPKARPASFDAPAVAPSVVKKQKRRWRDRLRSLVG